MYSNTDFRAFYRRVYGIIDGLTPVPGDCGRLCDKACCKGPDSKGMLLFPNEESALDISQFNIIKSPKGLVAVCNGTCERHNRPLACRMFPFFPRLFDDGKIRVVYDMRAMSICPIVAYPETIKPDRRFLRAVRHAGRVLVSLPDCRKFIKAVSDELVLLNKFEPMKFEGIAARFR
ncbi:MAG TPA: hypothetical protein GXX17_07935 [Clostridiales bacterium]|nr:hypothetical protein [Clostridiales bacterium]